MPNRRKYPRLDRFNMCGANELKVRDGGEGGDNSVVSRRRESTLTAGSGVVNDRSSAIGSIVNARDGVHRLIHDQYVREVWLGTLERAFLKRYFDRLLTFYPTAGEVSEYLKAQAEGSRQQGRGTANELVTNVDPYLELAYYAIFESLSKDPSAHVAFTRSEVAQSHVHDLLNDAKESALQMLLTWITQSNPSENSLITEFESVLLAREDRPGVKKFVRSFREMIRREMRFLREFVTKFVSEIAERISRTSGNSHLRRISQAHIPESFLCDDCAFPPPVKRAFLEAIEQLRSPNSDVNGAFVDLIDPSLNCCPLDNTARRSHVFADATRSRDDPEVFSAFDHGGQPSSSRLSKSVLLSGDKPSFQWLLSDVKVHSAEDVSATIESEVNSIHPVTFPAIYTGMAHLAAGFVPLFDQVLSSIATANPPAPYLQVTKSVRDTQLSPVQVIEHALATALTSQGATGTTGTSEESNTADESSAPSEEPSQEDRRKCCFDHCIPLRPRFDRNSTLPPAPDERAELQSFSLRGCRIQVIPKLSTIRLTPEHPKFLGQSSRKWLVDGDSDEQLVAIGYHVLEHENISTPELSFRAFAHGPPVASSPSAITVLLNYERAARDEFLAFGEKIAGYHEGRYGRKFFQPWGSMALHSDRSFTVPAFLAHRLESFELLDPKVSGHLALLTLYLVDPTQKIASTATLRPEEHDRH